MQLLEKDTIEYVLTCGRYYFIFHDVKSFRSFRDTDYIRRKKYISAFEEPVAVFKATKLLEERAEVFVTIHSIRDLKECGFQKVEFVDKPNDRLEPLEKNSDDYEELRFVGQEVTLMSDGYFIITAIGERDGDDGRRTVQIVRS